MKTWIIAVDIVCKLHILHSLGANQLIGVFKVLKSKILIFLLLLK